MSDKERTGDFMDFGELIGSYAFPIVMCLLMYIDNKDVRKSHKEEIDNLSKALENNTVVMQRLVDNMERSDKD